jgi:glycerol-3-phosphate dehydrogenase
MRAREPIPDTRAARIAALEREQFDLLVIGGGITGCGVARDAALRGLRVALVEKDDFASGTSSRSSRLVHGGVRYLEHGQLHLVFESSAERRRLLRLVPHLVRPLAFTWPVYRGARVGKWKLAAGLALYDVLSLFRNVGRHRQLNATAVTVREPELRPDGLRGGAVYFDAATDDARLTLANALGAVAASATVLNYAEVRGFRANGVVSGAIVTDRIGGEDVAVRATVVVNATGPWSDTLRQLEQTAVGLVPTPGSAAAIVRGSVGAHVAVPRERVGNRGALTLLSPIDGRVMFVLPDGAHSVIGTTERPADASPDDVRATERDVAYLLESANAFFPKARLTRTDVVSAWAGIRPLAAASDARDLGRVSREHAITHGPGGIVTITGGKLTTYRVMARQVVDHVERKLGRRSRRTPTDTLPLPGGDLASVDSAIAAAQATIGDGDVARRLVHSYGSRWHDVWERATREPGGTARISGELPYLMGEMSYAVEHDMACTLGDLLIRRTRLAFETVDHGRSVAASVAAAVSSLLGWDDAARVRAVDRFAEEARRIFDIDP